MCYLIDTKTTAFAITDAKFYVPVITLSTQDNANCLSKQNQVLKEQLIGTNIN